LQAKVSAWIGFYEKEKPPGNARRLACAVISIAV
jgi:hypothetical protein